MSAASDPAPRSKPAPGSRPRPGSRHSLFLPVLILILGSGALSLYQVLSMEEQLDQMTLAVDRYDARVKLAQYEKDKFYKMARAVLRLAPTDTNANQVATLFNLRELQRDKPELMNANDPSDLAAVTNAPTDTTGSTNSEIAPMPPTNAASPPGK